MDPTVETGLRICLNGHASLTIMPLYSKIIIKPRTAQMMILSLVAVTGLEKCCITSAYLKWLFHSGEQAVVRGSLVSHAKLLSLMKSSLLPNGVHKWSVCPYNVFIGAFLLEKKS